MNNETITAACTAFGLLIVIVGIVGGYISKLQRAQDAHEFRIKNLEDQHRALDATITSKLDRLFFVVDEIRQWIAEQRGEDKGRRGTDRVKDRVNS